MEDKIIERIKKLFALAGNNPNINEADLAMKMAKKLLDKHNLNMYQLIDKEEVGIKIEDELNMPYVRIIYNTISDLYDVEYLVDRTSKPIKHLLIGTESNRVTASIVIEFVLSTIRKESKGMGNGVRNSAAQEVYRRVTIILDERNNDTEEVIPGTGLIPVDASLLFKQERDEWIEEIIGKVNKGKKTHSARDSRGVAIGKKVSINTQISNRCALN